ncbi:MAG: Rrf2 family transcriptional regulator [Ruminococcaceae bacterium]|nr:Rrf2 family transcriptional regulator [Oscillospiraceae bacterium]
MISTKGRYALRVMIDLAQNDKGHYIPLKDIAERQQISKKYLETIVKDLVGAKLLTGVSGKGGGYKLARKPEDYTVAEILKVTEGSLAVVACLDDGAAKCPRAAYCDTLPMWTEYNNMIKNFFNSKRLSDLI